MKKFSITVIASLLVLVTNLNLIKASTENSNQGFDKIYVFGDSLSDEGYQDKNPIALQENKAPLWTSPGGHPWPYYLAKHLNIADPGANNQSPLVSEDASNTYVSGALSGTNYAAGGSTTGSTGFGSNPNYQPPSLLQQICYFTNNTHQDCFGQSPSIKADPNALYVIWSGSNDIFSGISSTGLNDELTQNSTQNIIYAIMQLQSASSVPLHILVIGLPDIGRTPMAKILTLENKISSFDISAFIDSFNLTEIEKLYQLNMIKTNGQAVYKIAYFSSAKAIDILTQTPDLFGKSQMIDGFKFVNNLIPACDIFSKDPTQTIALTCEPSNFRLQNKEDYVFEDAVHPSDETHQLLAQMIYEKLLSLKSSGFWS